MSSARGDVTPEVSRDESGLTVSITLPQDEVSPERTLQFRFTDEGLITDSFVHDDNVGTDSATYDELIERIGRHREQ